MVDADIQVSEQKEGAGASQPAPVSSILEKTETAIKKLEEIEKRIDEKSAILAKSMLGGRAEAGSVTNIETPDEKYKREAKIRYAGTGLDPTLGMP